MAYEYEGLVIITVYDLNSEMYPDKEVEIIKNEIKEVYAKARAFDEIVDEFGHYIGTLSSWETIDYKDTQTLLEIIKENMEE